MKRSILAAGASFLALTAAGAGYAQTASDEPELRAETIVVTARFKEETLSDTPLSIVAFGAPDIEAQRIDTMERLAFSVPSLNVSDPFGRNNPSFSMRGVGLAGIGDELPVGIFIDGVYVSGRSSASLFITDLERIEVVRGPQSALYGRNTFAGAINFVTKKPTDTPEGYFETTIGTDERYMVRAGFSGPLIKDRLAAHAGFVWRDWGGFYDNQTPGGPDLNRQKTTAGNLQLRFTPNDAWAGTFRLSFADDDDTNPAGFQVPANVALNVSNGGSLGFFRGEAPEAPIPGTRWADCCDASDDVTGYQRETVRAALTIEGELSEALTLTAITGWSEESQKYDNDADYLAEKLFVFGNLIDREEISQEVRLAFDNGGPLTWLVGAFGYTFDNRFENAGGGQFFLPPAIRRDVLPRTLGPFVSDTSTSAFAIFGSASYDFSPTVTGTFDLRWNTEEKDFDYTAPGRNLQLSDSWDSVLPRAIVEWSPKDGRMYYVNIAKGFKTGGFNDQVNVFTSERSYQPEENWTYELGAKYVFDGVDASLNAALFYIDWTDQQVVTVSSAGANNNTIIANAAQSTSQGFELDGVWRPLPDWTVSAAYSYVDATFDRYIDPAVAGLPGVGPGGDVSGKLLPRQSKHSFNGSLAYSSDLPGIDGTWSARLDYLYKSTNFATSANLAETGDQHKLNGRLTANYGQLEASLWVDNLLDERTPPVIIRFTDFASFFDPPVGALNRAFAVTPADGRTAGVTAKWRF